MIKVIFKKPIGKVFDIDFFTMEQRFCRYAFAMLDVKQHPLLFEIVEIQSHIVRSENNAVAFVIGRCCENSSSCLVFEKDIPHGIQMVEFPIDTPYEDISFEI